MKTDTALGSPVLGEPIGPGTPLKVSAPGVKGVRPSPPNKRSSFDLKPAAKPFKSFVEAFERSRGSYNWIPSASNEPTGF